MLAIRAARLFDGERFWPGPVTVLSDGPTVLGIEQGYPALPADTDVLDPGDATVLPGLIDSHTHLVGDSHDGALDRVAGYPAAELSAVVAESLRRQLASGVTAVRDLGDRDWIAVTHRDRQRTLSAPGAGPAGEPAVLASGPPITSPGGHCHAMGGEVRDRDEIARAVHERAERRVDVVKVMASGGMTTAGTDVLGTQFSDDDLAFLVREAHRRGLPVTAHAHSLAAVEQALAAGVDGLEHASCLTERGFRLPDAVLDLLVERQIPVGGALLGSPPATAFARAPAALRAQFERIGLTPESFLEVRLATVRRMHDAGVRFLAGRDSGISSFLAHGSLWASIAFYVEAGAAVAPALATATSLAADACGVGDRRGRIRTGSVADLLVVGGDVRADVARLADVRVVFRAGTPIAGP